MNALGVYLSIPFCRSKCSYCNFASGVYPASYYARYVERLIADLRQARPWAEERGARLPRRVDSIYLGGGTPSLLPPELLRRLFAALRAEFRVADGAEITVECAPGLLDDGFLAAMPECGVNRVSFGVQSFVDREAAVTGRLHNRVSALRDVARVQAAGIAANVDLIAGLPHQTAASWRDSLATLAASGVSHASIYMLEVDEDSRLGRELLEGGERYHAAAVPDDDRIADLYLEGCEFLEAQGLAQYEISNFARAGAESRHNLKYWNREPYLGVGVDAHSMLRCEDGHDLRLSITGDLAGYIEESGFEPVELHLGPVEQLEEEWFLGLRKSAGVDLRSLSRRYGKEALAACRPTIEELVAENLLEKSGSRVRLTRRGRLISNEVFQRFMGAARSADYAEEAVQPLAAR